MKDFLTASAGPTRRFLRAAHSAAKLGRDWLSVPVNLCLALLGAAFMISLLSWAIADHNSGYVLFFPDAHTGRMRGELRDLPRVFGSEARAGLVASEVLLGPADPNLLPDFALGSKIETTIYRGRKLYVDISDDAAVAGRSSIELGLACLRRSLATALPFAQHIIITIGGQEPYADYPSKEAGNDGKNKKNN
ncbi:MAG: GerMN domain-containing protein [Rectinemataceae bacterium]